jgi:ProP effector
MTSMLPSRPRLLGLAMRLYTSNSGYLRASMISGADRIDLDGNPAGTVTEKDAANAAQQLAWRAVRKARQKVPATPPAPPAPTVKRLSLADLREAARLRKQKASQHEASCK